MPRNKANKPKTAYEDTSARYRKEILQMVDTKILTLNDVKRPGSLYVSEEKTFHLDSKQLEDGRWKVEIQYGNGAGRVARKTVAVVMVAGNATSVPDFRAAVEFALNDGYVYEVT
jgi:hypothetical protein